MNKVVEKIRGEINALGTMSFERFMELALYCPDCGYYEKIEDRIGQRGDFYTSVCVGPLFGQLLAAKFGDWLQGGILTTNSGHTASTVGSGTELQITEAGAHDGRLARDILAWLCAHRPDLFKRLRYSVIEPSTNRRSAQERMLEEFQSRVCWFSNLQELRRASPSGSYYGVIFSNELLDAMPLRNYRWEARRATWFEWGVACDGERFCWAPMVESAAPFSLGSSADDGLNLTRLSASLPDGFAVEISAAAVQWWRDAARCLDRGWLLTLDYGLKVEELFSPSRVRGTLRAYRQHRLVQDVLAEPGEQDITAHVNFSSLQTAGTEEGLQSQEFTSQEKFLTSAATILWRESNDRWDSKSTRQFQTLTHPDHLGRTFQVLVQSRGLNG
jgi:SAM-dependent MidA family methyltransferase